MAGGFTDAYENTILNHVFRNDTGNSPAFTPPSTVYVGYSEATSTESNDANYVRQSVTFSAASGGALTNSSAITFPAVAAADTVVECALFTAQSGGTQMTDWKTLSGGSSISLAIGQQFRIPAGDLDVTLE